MAIIIVIIILCVVFGGGSKAHGNSVPANKAKDHREDDEDFDLLDLIILDEILGDDE